MGYYCGQREGNGAVSTQSVETKTIKFIDIFFVNMAKLKVMVNFEQEKSNLND